MRNSTEKEKRDARKNILVLLSIELFYLIHLSTKLGPVQRLHGRIEKYIEIPSTTLQNIMDSNNIEQLDFLKLDCEGSEGAILESTPKDYLRSIRKIAMEYHDRISILKHDDMQILLKEQSFTTHLKIEAPTRGYLYGWRN